VFKLILLGADRSQSAGTCQILNCFFEDCIWQLGSERSGFENSLRAATDLAIDETIRKKRIRRGPARKPSGVVIRMNVRQELSRPQAS
jgi:hypothetical protein